ncbi:PD-(D/E)XK motif protein [Stenotrophomonas rhizophila]|uniref:PD-(D/E)XK motif protein n=1 Tax=Stenotrophomonas rhizophila TaxID=216778 RepID=UPI00112F1673
MPPTSMKTPMPKTPHEHWLGLRERSRGDTRAEVSTVAGDADTGFGPVRFALTETASPRLLVPIASSTANLQVSTMSGPSVEVRISRLSLDGAASVYLDISLREPRLHQLFGELCTEMVSRIAAGTSPVDSVKSTIEDYRALLAESQDQSISRNSLVGLLGELMMLLEGAKRSSTAVESWTGPTGQRHDFRGRHGALEVKSTGYKQRTTIRIHGIEQLCPPSDAPLWLAHVVLESSQAGNIHVAALYNELVAVGVPSTMLLTRLASLGCNDPLAPEWNASKFSFEGMSLYSVNDRFPRLMLPSTADGSTPPGISEIEYTVDLSAAVEQMLPVAHHDDVLRAVFE